MLFLPVVEKPHARATILVEAKRVVPGRPFLAAVEVDTDPHWHVYWKNPGDSGIPTTVAWTAPKGWRVVPLEYPIPRRYTPSGIAAYGYEGKTLFLARVTPSSQGGNLKANVKWLVCSDACVPGGAMLSTPLTVGPHTLPTAQASRLKQALDALPTLLQTPPARAIVGKRVVLSISFPMKLGNYEFFPMQSGVVDHAKPWIATLKNSHLVFKMDRSPFPEKRSTLSGLIVSTRNGVRSAFTINAKLETGETK